jgi:DNA-binding NtrC family response regulator
MLYRDAKTLPARGQIQLKFAKRGVKLVGAFQCLIVSADAPRREMLERAACEGGWKTSACADADTALTYLSRSLVQLALVDLENQQPHAFHPVVEQSMSHSGLLLIVCGNEGAIEEEVWVRQLGAWLYLPGVTESSNLKLLCSEARHIAERLAQSKPGNPDRGPADLVARRKNHP